MPAAPTSTGTGTRRTLLVVAHPRPDSLTAQLADRARKRLLAAGHEVDLLDLHAEGFDPRMTPEDEPDWADPDKRYSPLVHAHLRRIEAADTIVVVFPLWWFGLPAILKGWIDRVWNNGLTYGRSPAPLHGRRMLWIALAAYQAESFTGQGWREPVTRILREGISVYCGIEDATVHFVHDTLEAGAAALEAADPAVDALTRPTR
ncbi:NAD(P)H oxidoreductase [Kitasatospora sp. NPDC004240]